MEWTFKRMGRCAASLGLVLGLVGSTGCRTEFLGDARFPGGALGCFKKCADINMDMATFVYVGEYSTACACKPRSRPAASIAREDDDGTEGATVAAAAGVVMQTRDAEAAAAANQRPYVAP